MALVCSEHGGEDAGAELAQLRVGEERRLREERSMDEGEEAGRDRDEGREGRVAYEREREDEAEAGIDQDNHEDHV